MRSGCLLIAGLIHLVSSIHAQEILNGQIYTPGIAIVNAPQPNTPLGGDALHIALDVTANGRLQLPPYPENSPSSIHNITIFLSSYITGRNFTIANGTASADNATFGDIMLQEEGSTVKHINWIWPDCLVGGEPSTIESNDRGAYNISIRQNFRLNGTEQYTIFDLPIQVTNSIPANTNRSTCGSINNPLISWETVKATASNFTMIPGSAIDSKGNSKSSLGATMKNAGMQGLTLTIALGSLLVWVH